MERKGVHGPATGTYPHPPRIKNDTPSPPGMYPVWPPPPPTPLEAMIRDDGVYERRWAIHGEEVQDSQASASWPPELEVRRAMEEGLEEFRRATKGQPRDGRNRVCQYLEGVPLSTQRARHPLTFESWEDFCKDRFAKLAYDDWTSAR